MKKRPNNWYNQSAVIPYRINNNLKEILVVTTRKKKKWTIPKGIIEENLSSIESAEKEAFEEAGILGKVEEKIFGEFKYKKWGSKCHVIVYPFLVEEELQLWEESFRERKWINENESDMYFTNKKLLKIIKKFFRSFN